MAQLLDQYGKPLLSDRQAAKRDAVRQLQARYDAAQTTRENERHWANADHLSPAAAANPEVRRKLRSRARYEIGENNSFAKGLVLTIAKDTIKSGPRLQLQTGNPDVDQFIEREFNRWAKAVRLASRLRLMRMSRAIDGEIFAVAKNNRRLPTPVRVDFDLIEGDQVTTPTLQLDPQAIDGIRFDEDGNPSEYDLLRQHPGTDRFLLGNPLVADSVPADAVIHYFREDRPGQKRGIPEVTPALPLFALWRRFLLATVTAAETAAEFSAVLQTDGTAVDPADVEPMDAIELERNAALTLPAGWKLGQIRSEHPDSTIEMFRNLIVSEVARCLLIPFNKALLNSQGYTFASGKLDRDDYIEGIETERSELETSVLDRLLFWWLDEALLLPNYLPAGLPPFIELPHSWHWDGFREADPNKQANADVLLWERGLLTDEEYLQRRGIDPDEHYRRLAEQNRRRQAIGMPLPGEKDRDPEPPSAADEREEEAEEREARAALSGMLEADSVPAELEFEAAPVEISAAEESEDGRTLRRVRLNAYSGGIMRPRGFPGDVVVDLDGLTVARGNRPILLGHDPRQIVGHTESVEINGNVTAEGVISGAGPAAQEVIQSAANGFPWRASIGARTGRVVRIDAGEEVQVNGQTFRGPLHVVRAARLQEISFVALPGDERTSATVQAEIERTRSMNFEQWLEARGYKRDGLGEAALQVLHGQYQREIDGLNAPTHLGRHLRSLFADANKGEAELVWEIAARASVQPDEFVRVLYGSKAKPTKSLLDACASHLRADAKSIFEAAEQDGHKFEGRQPADPPPNGQPADPSLNLRAQAAEETRRINTIRELCAGRHNDLEARAIEQGWDAHRTELEILRASRPRAQRPANDPAAGGWSPQAFEAALCMQIGISPEIAGNSVERLEATLESNAEDRQQQLRASVNEQEVDRAMTAQYRGLSLHALMDLVIEAAGEHYRGSRRTNGYIETAMRAEQQLQASGGFTTLSLSGILNNVANKRLIASYSAQRITWPDICAVRSNVNFKAHERHRLDSTGAYQKIGPDGELKHIGLGEEKFTTTLDTHGAIIALTRRHMIDDDLDAFGQIPDLLGRLAALKPEEEVYKLLLSNPSSFFSAGKNNILTGAGSALAISSLSDAVELFRNQVDSNGKPILVGPAKLVVPATLEVEAQNLFQNPQVVVRLDSADNQVVLRNPHAGQYPVTMSPYINNTAITDADGAAISGQSDTQWYLFADPAVRAAIAIAFLNGRRVPVLESSSVTFEKLGMQWRSYHDFGTGMEDTVAAVKSDGA